MGKVPAAAGFVRKQGAECIVLGCTELSLIKRDRPVGPGVLDALDDWRGRASSGAGNPCAQRTNS